MLICGLLNGFIPAKNSTDGQELIGEDEFWHLFWQTSTSLVALVEVNHSVALKVHFGLD